MLRQAWRVAPRAANKFSTSASCAASKAAKTIAATPAPVPPTDANQALFEVTEEMASRQISPPTDVKTITWDRFTTGRVLSPKDLTYQTRTREINNWSRNKSAPTSREARPTDVFHQLNADPRDFCLNAPVLYEFVSEMGKIYGRNVTRLTYKSQRLLGKTIRRAKQMGIMSNLSKPEFIRLK